MEAVGATVSTDADGSCKQTVVPAGRLILRWGGMEVVRTPAVCTLSGFTPPLLNAKLTWTSEQSYLKPLALSCNRLVLRTMHEGAITYLAAKGGQ